MNVEKKGGSWGKIGLLESGAEEGGGKAEGGEPETRDAGWGRETAKKQKFKKSTANQPLYNHKGGPKSTGGEAR